MFNCIVLLLLALQLILYCMEWTRYELLCYFLLLLFLTVIVYETLNCCLTPLIFCLQHLTVTAADCKTIYVLLTCTVYTHTHTHTHNF